MRWFQPLHPAAFLVNQDRGLGLPDTVQEVIDQTANLIRVLAITLEQDKSGRPGIGKKAFFFHTQGRPRTPVDHGVMEARRIGRDHCFYFIGLMTRQPTLRLARIRHRLLACPSSARGPARSR